MRTHWDVNKVELADGRPSVKLSRNKKLGSFTSQCVLTKRKMEREGGERGERGRRGSTTEVCREKHSD